MCWMSTDASDGIDALRVFHEECLKHREKLKGKTYYNLNGNATLGKKDGYTFHINGYDVMVGFGLNAFKEVMFYSLTPVGDTKAPTGFDIDSIERVLLSMVEDVIYNEYTYGNQPFLDAMCHVVVE